MKVQITNLGEDYATIVKEMTEEQYEFLLEISEELNAQVVYYTPTFNVIKIR